MRAVGTDRKIMYWDAFEGSAIRELEGSSSEQVSALAIDSEGEAIVSGGGDKLVKLWGYDEGNCYAMGTAHSGSVNRVAVTPEKSHVVSVGSEGAIMIWNYVAPSLTEGSLSVAASRNV
jgi:WD40 repeat protein